MVRREKNTALPEELHHYFWDYDPADLSWDGDRYTIVLRLLASGGLDAVRWLRENAGDEAIREVLIERRGRGISPERLRFWGLILDLPRVQVDEWVHQARSDPWHQRARGRDTLGY